MWHSLNEWLGIEKYQRHIDLVELKVAEIAIEVDYREIVCLLKEWTAVKMRYLTVADIVRCVGKEQADTGQHMIDATDYLPKSEKSNVLSVEANGVFVCSTKRRKVIDVSQAIIRRFGAKKRHEDTYQKAIESHNQDQFIL
jgi:hypothetical protein